MTEREERDTRLVWHCKERHSDVCRKNYYHCYGDKCRNYKPNPGSYNDAKRRTDYGL